MESSIEVSVVMPCLNEVDTLRECIAKAQRAFDEHDIQGEIIVADNGSTDGSPVIANCMGARLVRVKEKGYGSALMGCITASRGKFVIMGDADNSYDFGDLSKFVEKLRAGFDLVQGCRLPSGGGKVTRGAMPFLHRWWGNPMFSFMVRRMYSARIHDVYCGLRGFTRALFNRLDLRSTGIEFATEIIIKSSLFGERIAEVPITLYPDGRKSHAPRISRVFGFDRGQCVDRYYIESFLTIHAKSIHGHVLEVANNVYTMQFPGERVLKSAVLCVQKDNSKATIVADLSHSNDRTKQL